MTTTPDEITVLAEELTRYLTSPETTNPRRKLSGPWDSCTMAAGRQGPDEPLMPMLGIYDATVSLPAWAGTFDEHVATLLVFALEVLEPGPPLDDVQLLVEKVNDDAPDGSGATLERLREVTTYWRSRLAVEAGSDDDESDLERIAFGCTRGSGPALPQHETAARLRAAWLLIPPGHLLPLAGP